MGKKRARNTAKTGDKSLYKSRIATVTTRKNNNDSSDNDDMYNEVDRYHNRKERFEEEYIRFDNDDDDEEDDEDDGISGRENVFDLGIGGDSDDDNDDDDDDSSDEEEEVTKDDNDGRRRKLPGKNSEEFSDQESEESSEEEEEDEVSSDSDNDNHVKEELVMLQKGTTILNWGKRKSSYYHGDTADLEIGQDEDDAYLEEEAGKEVQRARYGQMEEEDFLLDDDEDEGSDDDAKKNKKEYTKDKKEQEEMGTDSDEVESLEMVRKDVKNLSRSDKMRLLKAQHPELLPLVTHFRDTIEELHDKTYAIQRALFGENGKGGTNDAEAVGATPDGLNYLLTKSILQTSTALNVCMYLLLKAESASKAGSTIHDNNNDFILNGADDSLDIKSHPVIARLNQLNKLREKLGEKVESKVIGLGEQMESLVKAAALMESEEGKAEDGDVDTESSDFEGTGDEVEIDDEEDEMAALAKMKGSHAVTYNNKGKDGEDTSSSSEEDENEIQRTVMNEARFAVRPTDVVTTEPTASKSRSKKSRATPDLLQRRLAPLEFGDEDDEDMGITTKASRALASTINAITQRNSVAENRKRKSSGALGDEVDEDFDEERFNRGLEMMEADIGATGSDEERSEEDEYIDDELDDGLDDENGFYERIKKQSKAKKEFKKSLYAVAPKYPGMDQEIEGERAIGRTIMKNRGLVAHKSRLNRNPRVKKREQYRKALIRRKGAVREVRTNEGHRYGGEETGIKSGISRSRKLGVR